MMVRLVEKEHPVSALARPKEEAPNSFLADSDDKDEWIVDSGATQHMTHDFQCHFD